ncbi:hypothetical protein [Methanohalobium sp.]|uniref:hypothetical protein n=1 Tax=Methanohalobium sp. TaxID=2837493 RepID=UPI0025E7DF6F|nr:hypothetical protein [Methanohalobium sp.]
MVKIAERSQYFDTLSYTSADFARHFDTISGTGYVRGKSNELEVFETSPTGLAINIDTGCAWVQGRFFEIYSEPETRDIPEPSDQDRIDRVVVRLDEPNRIMELDIIQGTPASDPSPPSLTRTTDIYEISLAQIYVTVGTTSISNSDITDERQDSAVCGASQHSAAGEPEAATAEDVRTYLSVQNESGSGDAPITWTTENYDNDNIFSPPDTDIVIPYDGIWLFRINIKTDQDEGFGNSFSNAYIGAVIKINGSNETVVYDELSTSSLLEGISNLFPLTPILHLQKDDIVTVEISDIGTSDVDVTYQAYLDLYNLIDVTL